MIVSLCFFSSQQAVGFLWGYYIQQFGATIIIVAAGFIVSCIVSNETTPFTLALFARFNFTSCCVYNCKNQPCPHIFLHSSDIWTFVYSIGTIKVVSWYFIPPSRLPTLIGNYSTATWLVQLVEPQSAVWEVEGSSPRPDQHSGS